MKACFTIRDGAVTSLSSSESESICVYAAPDPDETNEILDVLWIDRYDVDSALDADELSRVEFAADRLSLIWKQPKHTYVTEAIQFDVSSVGAFLDASRLAFITGETADSLQLSGIRGAASLIDVLLKYLFNTIRHFNGHLKAIRQITADLETKIGSSMENRYLLQMFALGESLTYYLSAIEANGAALLKLAGNAERIRLSKQQREFLSDIELENKQCARQAQIYSSVLSGLMDARGTIINNNMNVLLKKLTIINVVFLPLNLIASIGGMSEFSMMTEGIIWQKAYSLFTLGMIILGLLTWLFLARHTDKNRGVRPMSGRAAPRLDDERGFR